MDAIKIVYLKNQDMPAGVNKQTQSPASIMDHYSLYGNSKFRLRVGSWSFYCRSIVEEFALFGVYARQVLLMRVTSIL